MCLELAGTRPSDARRRRRRHHSNFHFRQLSSIRHMAGCVSDCCFVAQLLLLLLLLLLRNL
jgi:hypothetical protein